MDSNGKENIVFNSINNTITKLNLFSFNLSHLPHKHSVVAKGDSGASKHYFNSKDIAALNNVKILQNGPTVMLPDNPYRLHMLAIYCWLPPSATQQKKQQHLLP